MLSHSFDRRPWAVFSLVMGCLLAGCQSPATSPVPTAAPAPSVMEQPQAPMDQPRAAAQPERHVTGLGWGGHFNWLALPQPDSGLPLYDAANNTVVQVPAISPFAAAPLVQADGTIAFVDEQGLGIYDPTTKLIRRFPSLHAYPDPNTLSVGPGGSITYADGAGLHLVSPRGDDWVAPGATRNLPFPIDHATRSPNGRYAVYSAGGVIYLYDIQTGNQYTAPFTNFNGFDVRVFDVSADGRSLLFASDGTLRKLDLRTGWSENYSLVPGWFDDARLGPNGIVYFIRNGQLQSYNPQTGLLDTMPIANRTLYGF